MITPKWKFVYVQNYNYNRSRTNRLVQLGYHPMKSRNGDYLEETSKIFALVPLSTVSVVHERNALQMIVDPTNEILKEVTTKMAIVLVLQRVSIDTSANRNPDVYMTCFPIQSLHISLLFFLTETKCGIEQLQIQHYYLETYFVETSYQRWWSNMGF